MAKGDQVKVRRGWYDHHGIDAGDGTIIHLRGEPGRQRGSIVVRVSALDFAQGNPLTIVDSPASFDAERIVARAASRIGETGYNILLGNCEHFASWCRTGRATSLQVQEAALHGMRMGIMVRAGASVLARRTGLAVLAPILGPIGTGVTIAAAGILLANQLQSAD